MPESAGQPERFDEWAIVEVMGHRTFAGRVTEQTIGGASFVRVDVPAAGGRSAFCKLLGAGSIYGITPVSEGVARRVAESLRNDPVPVYCPDIQPALPLHRQTEEPEDGDPSFDDAG